jgi:hypothetical protein
MTTIMAMKRERKREGEKSFSVAWVLNAQI